MSEYFATIRWARNDALFTDNRYSRVHTLEFDGGAVVKASASPHNVRVPFSDPAGVDPEEAFVASLSSCHMLWFLNLAAKRGFTIDSYLDQALGVMEKNAAGKMAITKVTLRPQVAYGGEKLPTPSESSALHHEAHENCFIANSVKTDVLVEPV
jgi:organic hydroperoxide reductase OsmC/OhrA